MINSINEYLEYLDKVLDNIPKSEKVLKNKLINTSYGLINSKSILVDVQYIDYLLCYMLKNKYINYQNYAINLRMDKYIHWITLSWMFAMCKFYAPVNQ